MTASPTPLRVAFVGAGQMAGAHLRALSHTRDRVVISGVFDADSAVAMSFAVRSACRHFPTIAELLAGARPDIVHICTPAGMHYDAARAALEYGAHIYVEKPFAESVAEVTTLRALAAPRKRLICSGHQLLADPAFDRLCERMPGVAPFVLAESRFSFQSPTLRRDATVEASLAQLVDILPHPLYSLVALLERMAAGERPTLASLHLTTTSIDALIVAGGVRGRLCVDLRARPVGSTLSVTGSNGTITADFIRGSVTGLANPGTSPIEKAANQVIEGAAIAWRSGTGVVRRLLTHGEYPGLVPHLDRFHAAIRNEGISPTSPEHLTRVTMLHETIADAARRLVLTRAHQRTETRRRPVYDDPRPVAVLTGAGGFLGKYLARRLEARGFSVWGVGRGPDDGRAAVDRWIRADVSRPLPDGAFDGASVVIHAAAATSGGFDAHQRHSVESAECVVRAAAQAGVTRFVLVSSLSTLMPPASLREVQSESTPLASRLARDLGPYTWGKCVAEERVRTLTAAAGMSLRVIRPGAFFDPGAPELPGLVGKRLFGPWHLGLGTPSHPFAAIAIDDCANAIAWCAAEFDEAPPTLNLFDPSLDTRAALIERLQTGGWKGRMVWVPVSALAGTAVTVRRAIAMMRRSKLDRLAIWQVLRPRRFDPSLSASVFRAMRLERVHAKAGPLVAA